jgi:phosphopantetheinyl transferase
MSTFIDILAAETKYLSFDEEQYIDDYSNQFMDAQRKSETLSARYLLNQLCIKHTGNSIHELHFKKNEKGKPFFELNSSLFCSISHAKGFVTVGLSSTNIGIDIEMLDYTKTEELELAFTKEEWMEVNNNSHAIIRAFSFKESLSKYLGVGFTVNPHEIIKDHSLYYQSTIINNSENSRFILTIVNDQFKDIPVRLFQQS